jgi:hypothetical protein
VIDAPAESAAPPIPREPVQIVFSSPTDGETDVTATGAIRIQFSRGLSEPSLAGHVRVSYVGGPPLERTPACHSRRPTTPPIEPSC